MSTLKQSNIDSFFTAVKSERREMKRRLLTLRQKGKSTVIVDLTIDGNDTSDKNNVELSPSKKSKPNKLNLAQRKKVSGQLFNEECKEEQLEKFIDMKIKKQSIKSDIYKLKHDLSEIISSESENECDLLNNPVSLKIKKEAIKTEIKDENDAMVSTVSDDSNNHRQTYLTVRKDIFSETSYGNIPNHEISITEYDNSINHLNIMFDEIKQNKEFKLLLTKEHYEIFDKLTSLNFNEYKLCTRLFYRKSVWQRTDNLLADKKLKLNYDSTEMTNIIKILHGYNFIDVDIHNEDVRNMLELLKVPELKNLTKMFNVGGKNMKKEDSIEKLIANTKKQRMLFGDPVTKLKKEVCKMLGTCFRLSGSLTSFLQRIHLLYGITEHKTPQELHRFLIEYLRKPDENRMAFKIDYPKLFQNEEEFSEYEKYRYAYEKLINAIENKDNDTAKFIILDAFEKFKECVRNKQYISYIEGKPSFLRKFSCLSCLISILSEGVAILKREIRTQLFPPDYISDILDLLLEQDILRVHKKHEWLKEKFMILKTIDLNMAAEKFMNVINEGQYLNSELCQIYVNDELQSFLSSKQIVAETKERLKTLKTATLQIDRFPSIEISAVELPNNMPGRKKLYKSKDDDGQSYNSVEDVAINYYKRFYAFEEGIHCEGGLLSTLYELLFWDLTFEFYVPNTFISPIQSKPLDMYSSHFYYNRIEAIDERLYQIEMWTVEEFEMEITKVVEKTAKYITASIYSDVALLMTFVKCIKREVLIEILRKFIEHYGTYRAGFPDLILWNTQQKKCKFVEVKGQKDKLRPKQILWLRFLLSIGADAEICHVHTTGYSGRKV